MRNLAQLLLAVLLLVATGTISAAERAGVAGRTAQSAYQDKGFLPIQLLKGQEIDRNARITTDHRGGTELLFDDDTKLTIGPNSDVTIDDFVYSPSNDIGQAVLRLGRGAIRMISGRVGAGRVRIETPIGTIGIRGTSFKLETRGPEELAIWVDEGTISLAPSGNPVPVELSAPVFAICTASGCVARGTLTPPIFFPPSAPDPNREERRSRNGSSGSD